MSAKTPEVNKDEWPTPDREIPGVTDLSKFRPGDQIRLDDHANSLVVQWVGVKTCDCADGSTVRQYALEAEHDRADAATHTLIECVNLIDGSTIEIVDISGSPLRVFEVDDE